MPKRKPSLCIRQISPTWGRAALLLLTLAGLRCNGDLAAPAEPAAAMEQLSLLPSNPQIAQGTAQQFTLRGLAKSGQLRDRTAQATWRVAREGGAATPLPKGGLLALAEPGRYRVTAVYADRQLETVITVTAATLKSLAIGPSAPKVAKGMTQPFTATATFSDGSTQDVTRLGAWSVKDVTGTAVATINTLGVATAKNVGTSRVSVRYKTLSGSTTLDVTAVTLVTLAVSPSSPTIASGSSQAFHASGTYSDGSVQDLTADADWAVADLSGSGVASIDGLGVATGLAAGQATVSAAYSGLEVETTLTVTPATPVALAVSPLVASAAKGTTKQFAAIATFSDGSTQDVTAVSSWSTSDVIGTGVAAVNGTGLATGNAVGSASVDCGYQGLVASASLQVTGVALTGLMVSPTSATIAKSLTQAFTVVGTYADGSRQDLTARAVWTTVDVSGTGVASVSISGLAVGKNLGTATVKATYVGFSASATLTVVATTVSSLAITPLGPILRVGATQPFTATGTLSDGTKQDLTHLASWTATDLAPASGVASIDSSGLATGTKAGQTTISAQYMGLRATTVLTVQTRNGICSSDGWCWRNPLPQGSVLRATWSSDANNVWVVGDEGIILKWNGTTWAAQPSGTTMSLDAVWGTDANNVWVVGRGGTILKWNGIVWTSQLKGFPQDLSGVWGSDANNVWAVGGAGTMLKWDGTGWSTLSSGTTLPLYGVWGTDANNVWAVGYNGTIIKWSGTAWVAQPSGTTEYLMGVWGTDANNIWAVASRGVIVKWNGVAWAVQPSGSTQDLYAVGGSSASNVWAVGWNGTILKWTGSTWSAQPSGSTQNLLGVRGSDANNIWAVGYAGTILKWNGAAWSAQATGSMQGLAGVWGSDAGNVWAVGKAGTILKWSGTAWVSQTSGTTQDLHALWGTAANNVWAVGNAGTILKWNGSAWSAQPSGTTEDLFAVWGSDASHVWVAGSTGTVLKWNGTAWVAQASGTTQDLYSVWGSDANNVWAVGYAGVIVRWNGTFWAPQTSGTTQALYSAWGSDANNIWAVGWEGTIVKWNGSTWTTQVSTGTGFFTSVSGSDAHNVWAIGMSGTILKWNGSTWSTQDPGTIESLYGVWASDANNVWAVGQGGAILQYGS